MKNTFIALITFFLIIGCTGLDPNVGKKMEGGIDYNQWVEKHQWLRFDLVYFRLDDFEKHEDHDTLTFTAIKRDAPPEHRSFNRPVEHMGTELTLKLYMLDEKRYCFDRVSKFKRINKYPKTFTVDVPHDERFKYFVPYYGVKWYIQH